ncbi:MFS transporter [Nitratireductor pacificus]|uniref:ABC transporter permease n=1 Tax=Nitratireductor pacificus pht-3B TaxID=391937 RepID=K2MGQ9_9HYPH|nr:MFS transporter [Nitratireductor pacificus]EKF19890.1 ABC transporter permease [Nitratireductor pacificus pht-3B]
MPNPYSEIFKAPGTKAFAAAGFIARLPLSMATMGTVTMLSQTHGEYWLAGAVSATFALTNAVLAPQVSRLVDRFGQSRVLSPAVTISVLAFSGLIAAAHYGWANWLLFLFALLAGVMPSMPAMLRARWTALYRDTPMLHTAFAFESVLDEVIYMMGSVFAISLSVALFPEAGPMLSTLFLAIGTVLFVAQKSTEPPVHAPETISRGSAIALAPLQILTFTLIAVGTMFGTAEVTVIAFSEELGQQGYASLVLAGYAAGSLLVGLVFGALKLKMPLAKQFLLAIAFAMVAALPLLAVWNIPTLAVVLFIGGASISPTFITAFGLIERLVPPAKLTEGITWAMTGIGIGMATGSFISGFVIDTFGAQNGFWVSITASGVAFATALLGYRVLQAPGRTAAPEAAIA